MVSGSEENGGGRIELIAKAMESEALAEAIRMAWNREPVETIRPFAEEAKLEVYFDSPEEARLALAAMPASWPVLSAEAVAYRAEEWTTFWRHHFRPMEIGSRLRIVPEWETAPADDRETIFIRPGLSFGTGGHFTTRFCLEALEETVAAMPVRSMIDAGSGSGILSIAAVKLGVESVSAFDMDPVCVEQGRENAERNGVGGCIRFSRGDVLEPGWFSEPVDLLCANILTSVLLRAAPAIRRAAKFRIVLSGIREEEADAVAGAFVDLGCREIARAGDGCWCGLTMQCR